MRTKLLLAVAITVAMGSALAAPVTVRATDVPAPGASEAVQKYALAVSGMT